jgi:hypothetical protein
MTIWNILWPFGIIYGRLVLVVVICYIFSQFGMFGPRKIWQPWFIRQKRKIFHRTFATKSCPFFSGWSVPTSML